jgi:hypothetical protein
VLGDKAELEAAQKAAEWERSGDKNQGLAWHSVAIQEMRGPHESFTARDA